MNQIDMAEPSGRPPVRPLSSLLRRLDRMERRRSAFLQRLRPLTAAELCVRPSPGSWHVLEVVEHVVIVEERVLGAIVTRPGPLPLTERVRSRLRLSALRLYLRSGGRVKAPNPALLPPGGATLDELVARWDRTRAGYAAALASFGPTDLVRPMMKHPFIGKLTPSQTLTFLDSHLAHHSRQIDRIREALKR